ncbi:MAG TPA: type II toxin-antitoxin system VapC family toxin [Gammaproteobacteria bacterium]|nr:type II toxin-antitoxin system VapC family toxin [Gammaproteobacteria bacterium]
MKYMLDTNICIYLIKKQPEQLLNKFKSCKSGDVCISTITLAELMYGVGKGQHSQKNKSALEEFISPLEIMPFDQEATTHYGHIRAWLEKNGTPIGPLDLMIAAHAKSLHTTLVTNNKKEFIRVPKLKIEDWSLSH